jgi:hypothetical protein
LAVEPGAEAVDNGCQIGQQILGSILPMLGLVDNLDGTPLVCEQRLQIAKAKTRQAVLMLDYDHTNALICEQRQDLAPRIIDAEDPWRMRKQEIEQNHIYFAYRANQLMGQ